MADKCKFLLNMTKNIEQHTADCKGLDVTVNHKIKLLYKQTNMLIPSKQYPSNAWKVPCIIRTSWIQACTQYFYKYSHHCCCSIHQVHHLKWKANSHESECIAIYNRTYTMHVQFKGTLESLLC